MPHANAIPTLRQSRTMRPDRRLRALNRMHTALTLHRTCPLCLTRVLPAPGRGRDSEEQRSPCMHTYDAMLDLILAEQDVATLRLREESKPRTVSHPNHPESEPAMPKQTPPDYPPPPAPPSASLHEDLSDPVVAEHRMLHHAARASAFASGGSPDLAVAHAAAASAIADTLRLAHAARIAR